MKVIFKFLNSAENLHSEYSDGAEFIFDVILTQNFFWPPRGILTPQNVETPHMTAIFLKLLESAEIVNSE